MARKTLTDAQVEALKPREKKYTYPDPVMAGLYVRVQPTGSKTFAVVSRGPDGKQVWQNVGTPGVGAGNVTIAEAREAARAAVEKIKAGKAEKQATTFDAVSSTWFKRHAEGKGLLTAKEIRRILDKYVLPTWGSREFESIRRGDVASLLDTVEDENGRRQADYVLAVLRSLFSWHQARNENYVSPVVRGMKRADPKAGKRDRILNDDEIRAVWARAGATGTFGAMIRFALTTAQRREKVSTLRWDDIDNGVWSVPSDDREKGTGGDLKLSDLALAVVNGQPEFDSNPFVFAGRGGVAFNGFSKAKAAFDKECKIEPWVLHDLRRTARSLLSRAGVRPDISERVLGHLIAGVEGIYDRHSYDREKADALAALDRLLTTILDPAAAENVVPLRA
jgi:integrase